MRIVNEACLGTLPGTVIACGEMGYCSPECVVIGAFDAGAAVAFGLMGMAEAIRSGGPTRDEWIERLQRWHAGQGPHPRERRRLRIWLSEDRGRCLGGSCRRAVRLSGRSLRRRDQRGWLRGRLLSIRRPEALSLLLGARSGLLSAGCKAKSREHEKTENAHQHHPHEERW